MYLLIACLVIAWVMILAAIVSLLRRSSAAVPSQWLSPQEKRRIYEAALARFNDQEVAREDR